MAQVAPRSRHQAGAHWTGLERTWRPPRGGGEQEAGHSRAPPPPRQPDAPPPACPTVGVPGQGAAGHWSWLSEAEVSGLQGQSLRPWPKPSARGGKPPSAARAGPRGLREHLGFNGGRREGSLQKRPPPRPGRRPRERPGQDHTLAHSFSRTDLFNNATELN